ncbi:MAG: four helix bundle protein [Chloroflexota bacterium]|nr:four helix bundle protein [Chloroflexota bacterium]
MEDKEMTFEEWVATVPERVKAEACYRFVAYPKALYLYELAWDDCDVLMRDERGRAVARQLIRSVGSISANVEEGHGRGVGGKSYLYFLRIAEGSARESKGWYFRARRLLGPDIVEARHALLDEILALLVTEKRRHQSRHP